MKGKIKRNKGQFKDGHYSVMKGKKVKYGDKCLDLKRTYVRIPKKTLEKVKSIPRSIKQFTANDGRPKFYDSPVVLRPRRNSLNLDPANIKSENNAR